MYPQDDIMIMRYELPGENVAFSRDEAQRSRSRPCIAAKRRVHVRGVSPELG